MKFYNTVFLLALLPSTVSGELGLGGACTPVPNADSCRSGLVCNTSYFQCLHGLLNNGDSCASGNECRYGYCDPTSDECANCDPSDVDNTCNGTGGIGGALACVGSGLCLVGVTGDFCLEDAHCLSGICDGGTCAAPPVIDPCLSVNCGPGGKCISMGPTDVSCRCENTFQEFLNSNGKPYCDCEEGTSFNADANRCFAPPTMAPTKEPTVSPTASPTASPTSSPTETQNNCLDAESETFVLDNGEVEGCDWLTKNSKKEDIRKNNYCSRHEVKTLCPLTCDFCECNDDPSYTFTLANTGNTVDCSWLTKNESKMEKRTAKYCTEDFDGGILLDACTKSCGKCLADDA